MRPRDSSWRLGRLPHGLVCFVLVIASTCASDLPYYPTRLFSTTLQHTRFVYVLDPPSAASPAGRLRSITTTSSFPISNPSIKILTSSLPFVDTGKALAFTSSLDPTGALNVLVGNCSAGAPAASLWVYTPVLEGESIQGSWSKQSVNSENVSGLASQVGVNYLASSISFAATPNQNASIYTFAGMCPYANSSDADWVSSAAYSNQLLILDHDQASQYDFELGSGRGQPIQEAGFSVTALQPTFSASGDGGPDTSQNFLLLGGHTQDAFINMSQVALFSLPQASWTFLPVTNDDGRTDLRSRQAPRQTEPRSGHTAVLSRDGSKVIVFGGWVGDISTPAEPQLAILSVGAGYGGAGGWSWTSTPVQPPLAAGITGIYGHGATMLDGDIMMVIGGWTMSAVGSRKSKRAGDHATNNQNLLYNVTSGNWIQNYVPPPAQTSSSSSADNGGLLSTKPQKVGLGVGLTFGVLAIIIATVIGWLISKRFKKQLRAREEELREKEIDELHRFDSQYEPTGPAYYSDDGPYQRPVGIWDGRSRPGTYGGVEPNIWRNDSVREAERSGLDLDIPSPHRGLRRSMAGRQMHSGRGFDERRASRGSGIIHPIEETDEEEIQSKDITQPEALEDPFKDPEPQDQQSGSAWHRSQEALVGETAIPSPDGPLTPAEEKSPETSQWVQEWAASTSSQTKEAGCVSPDKSERTESNLSERSIVSQITARTNNTSSDSSSRSRGAPSPEHPVTPARQRRSLRILPAALNPFATTTPSPTSPTRSRHSVTPTSQPPNTADSFITAPTSFATLQSESDALLGPARPGQARFQPKPPQTAGSQTQLSGSFDTFAPDNEPTFIIGHRRDAHKAPTGKVGSWVGSVRRAVAQAGRSASLTSSGTGARNKALAQVGPSGGLTVYDVSAGGRGEESPASSPTKKGGLSRDAFAESFGDGLPERERDGMKRSASEGATSFLVKRKGAKDWGWDGSPERHSEVEPDVRQERSQSMANVQRPTWEGPSNVSSETEKHAGGLEDEWDVERAVESRNVQVMFSVPKERLRVVNADVDAASIASSQRSVSGGKGGHVNVDEIADAGIGRNEREAGLVRARSRNAKGRQ